MAFIVLTIGLLLLFSEQCISQTESREITHEDIKDAMLSLVHMMRDNTEKLERHEARDRQTAEQLKKAVSLLTKRMSSIDSLKIYLIKLEERVANIEQLISQDERERIQNQKTADSLEDLESRLEGWATEIESKVVEGLSRATPTTLISEADRTFDLLTRIEASEIKLSSNVDHVFNGLHVEVQGINKKIENISQILERLESSATLILSNHINPVLEKELGRKQKLAQPTTKYTENLPGLLELQTMQNHTQTLLAKTRDILRNVVIQGNENIQSRIAENKIEAQNTMDVLRSDLVNISDRISQKLHNLGNGQAIMVEVADHVLDTKKRLEHAYKILREVGELVVVQGFNINQTLNTRFNGISNDIMDNQNGALANLTVKMEQEIDQVWRQINVMYQQMMESAKALDKLHKQNEAYVNETTKTMDGMENKVGEITKRMSEVDTNLNFLLGRLSLITHEFKQIKQGLGTTLDNIKISFKEVEAKINDSSIKPGPHPVPHDYKPLDESLQPNNIKDHSTVDLPTDI